LRSGWKRGIRSSESKTAPELRSKSSFADSPPRCKVVTTIVRHATMKWKKGERKA
jgi:hypothetical protein